MVDCYLPSSRTDLHGTYRNVRVLQLQNGVQQGAGGLLAVLQPLFLAVLQVAGATVD